MEYHDKLVWEEHLTALIVMKKLNSNKTNSKFVWNGKPEFIM